MQIDWFTVTAQVVNFLVLVYLLKRFLYGPIITAMDRREHRIGTRLREAEERVQQADSEALTYRAKQQDLERKREALLAEAKEAAEGQRAVLLDQLRKEVDETRKRWTAEVERERRAFLREVREQIGEQVCAVARRSLRDLANAELEERIIREFGGRLRALGDSKKQALAEAARAPGPGVTVVSTFDIPQALRSEVVMLLHEQLASDIEIRFELLAPGRKVAWSIDSYLQNLETDLSEALAVSSR